MANWLFTQSTAQLQRTLRCLGNRTTSTREAHGSLLWLMRLRLWDQLEGLDVVGLNHRKIPAIESCNGIDLHALCHGHD